MNVGVSETAEMVVGVTNTSEYVNTQLQVPGVHNVDVKYNGLSINGSPALIDIKSLPQVSVVVCGCMCGCICGCVCVGVCVRVYVWVCVCECVSFCVLCNMHQPYLKDNYIIRRSCINYIKPYN